MKGKHQKQLRRKKNDMKGKNKNSYGGSWQMFTMSHKHAVPLQFRRSFRPIPYVSDTYTYAETQLFRLET